MIRKPPSYFNREYRAGFTNPFGHQAESAVVDLGEIFTRAGQTMAFGVDGVQIADSTVSWLGAPVDLINRHIGNTTWAGMISMIEEAGTDNAGADETLIWTVFPMRTSGDTLAGAAAGDYNANYTALAQAVLANHNRTTGPIIIRPGHEFNGNWQPWAAQDSTNGDYFKAMWIHFRTCFLAVSNRFKFCWCPNVAQSDPDLAYPGDSYVDLIGVDFYYDAQAHTSDWNGYWGFIRDDATSGLTMLVNYAAAAGKPLCVPEWGVKASTDSDVGEGNTADEDVDASGYITLVADWLVANSIFFHCYWDSNAATDAELSSGQYPLTGARFQLEFGAPDIETATPYVAFEDEAISIPLVSNHAGTFSISGGADAALFSIVGSNLTSAAKDFDAPADANSDNDYLVSLGMVDARGLTDTLAMTVTINQVPTLTIPGGNILSNAEAIDNAYWTKLGLTVTANQAAGVNPASNTAERLIETSSGGAFHRFVRAFTTTTGIVYRASAVVKVYPTDSVRYVNLALSQGRATFDLQTGVVTSTTNAGGHPTVSNASITYKGAGRWLLQADFTEVSGGSREFKFDLNRVLSTGADSPFYNGNGTSGVYVAAFYAVTVP